MKFCKCFIAIIFFISCFAIESFSQDVTLVQNSPEGIVFQFDVNTFKEKQSFTVSLWDAVSNEEKYFTMGYSEDGTVTIPCNYRIPVGANIKATPRAGLAFTDSIYFSANTPVYFTLPITPLLNGQTMEESTFPIKNIFGEILFKENSDIYNQDLAELALTGCVFSYPTKKRATDELIIKYFKELDFEDIETYNYHGIKSTEKSDLTGFAIAHRKLVVNSQIFDVIFVIIRGTVNGEWYSNFDIGFANTHDGFTKAKNNVYEKFKEYLTKYGLDKAEKTKIFVTGHSRGASVSGLFSENLLQNKDIEKNNLYVYTFAAPNFIINIENKESYHHIWNFINTGDLVPAIPVWEYQRYGNNILSNSFTKEQLEMAKKNFFNATDFKFVGFKDNEITKAVNDIEKLAPTVKDYYETKYHGKKLFNMKSMTTYEYCTYMVDVLVKGEITNAMKSPKEFNSIGWFFIKDGAVRPAILQSHSLEYYLSLLYAYKNEAYDKSKHVDNMPNVK